jgi:4-amino-4-deoxy-L-arabinose transferase-like glycosyltransferase
MTAMTGMLFLFWIFLRHGDRRAFAASAILGGLAFSCKFTAALAPPILGLLWFLSRWRDGDRRLGRMILIVTSAMMGYLALMAISNIVVTGGAVLPISESKGTHPVIENRFGSSLAACIGRLIEMPIPQDWVGFARQAQLQRSGAPSYLFGERRETGWSYYYLVALAVKVPISFWLILLARACWPRRIASAGRDWILPVTFLAFLAIASLGSSRNFGLRYLLPVAPPAIVWISGLAEGSRWSRRLVWAGLLGQVLAVASIHPYELTYFNVLAGGPIGGRRILADSNLDWSQGLKPLARLQHDHPEFRDLTLYYFGDTEPSRYGVVGRSYVIRATNPVLPSQLAADTTYLAVSASLQWGPWGPPGFFHALDQLEPVCYTADTTIAIYRTADLARVQGKTAHRSEPINTPRRKGPFSPRSARRTRREEAVKTFSSTGICLG